MFPLFRREGYLAIAISSAFCFASIGTGRASTFQVNPIRITLTQRGSSSLLAVRNDSSERLRLQVDFYAWDQSIQGEMILNRTEDLVVYPSLLIVDAGKERNVRVGTKNPVVSREKSYRIFIEELPQATKSLASGIRILTRIGVPVFIQPQNPQPHGSIEKLTVRNSEIAFEVINRGNSHFVPRKIKVNGTDTTGANVFEKNLNPWYILAGGSRQYHFEISPSDCSKIRELTVEVGLEEKILNQQYLLPANSCNR